MTTTALTTLPALAVTIREEHAAACQAAESALTHALRCGKALIAAKEQVPHGQWLPWLAANCPDVSARTAQRWTRLATHEDVLANATRATHLSIRGALELLADEEPNCRTLDEVANEILPAIKNVSMRLAADLERDDLTVDELLYIRDTAAKLHQIAGELTVRIERAMGQLLNGVPA